MASYNRVTLIGNLTREPEVRYTQGGTAVCEVGLAVNDKRKDAQGNWIEEVSFFDVTFWGHTAEIVGEYLDKGSSLLVEGRLKQESWEKGGQKRSKVKVICEKMVMLGGGKGRYDEGGESQPRQQGRSSGGQRRSSGGGGRGRSAPPPEEEYEPKAGDVPRGERLPTDDSDIPF